MNNDERQHWNKHQRKPWQLPKGWPERFGYVGVWAFILLMMVSPSFAIFWFLIHLFGNEPLTKGLLLVITIPPAVALSGTFIGVYLWATRDQWPLNIQKSAPNTSELKND